MLDRLTYVNSKGEEVLLGQNNILLGSNDVRDYSLNYSTIYEVIASFSRGQTTKKIPITIFGSNAYDTANQIFNIFMYDVVKVQPGKLYAGDYYMQGYIYANTKSVYGKNGIYKTTLSFVTDSNVWIKETKASGSTSEERYEGLDFPFDYNFDYFDSGASAITNSSLAPADFRLLIYGNDNERIKFVIGDNMYIINEALATGEIIVIDSKNKTLIKTDSEGNSTNIFSSRGKTNYIFEKIASGRNEAYFDGFEWEAVIYEQRSEPLWT